MIALLPEPEQGGAEPQRPLRVPRGYQARCRRAEVVVLDVAAAQPGLALGRIHLERFFLGDDQHVRGVRALGRRRLAVLEQPLAAVLAERLQHQEPRLAVVGRALHEQAVVHEGGDAVEHVDAEILSGVADRFRAFSVQPPANTDRRRKSFCSSRREQVVAPLDGLAQRLLALRQIAGAAGQQLRAAARFGSADRLAAGS